MSAITWLVVLVILVTGAVLLARGRSTRRHQQGQTPPQALERTNTAPRKASPIISWETDVASAFSHFSFFKDDALSWMTPIIRRDVDREGIDAIARKIRSAGDAVGREEKKSLGLRANTKLGKLYLEALTEKGRADPMMAAFLVVQRVSHQRSCRRQLDGLRDIADATDVTVEVSFIDDGRDCEAVKKLKGKEFPLDEVPDLPLPECNAEFCRCMYVAGPSTFGEA